MNRLSIFLLTAFFATSTCFAQDFSKVGTGSAQFLKIDVGARSVALGGAYVAMADDIFAMFWNPAGIARMDRRSVGFSHKRYIADLNHNYLGFLSPLGENGSIGLHAIFMSTDPIEITTIDQPRGTATYYQFSNLALGLSYARWMSDRLTIGATVKYVRESIYRERAQGLAFDIGSLFDTGIFGIRLGMSLANFGGSLRLDGPDIDSVVDTDERSAGNRTTPARLRTLDFPLPLDNRPWIFFSLFLR